MLLMNSRRIIAVARWTFSIVALTGIIFVYRRWLHVNPTTVALTLLLYILVLASVWSLRLAIVTSVVATAAYNFFFLPPFFTLTIADPQNWLALFSFLTTALLGSRLSRKARDEAEEARARQRELETLFALSREMLATDSVAAFVEQAPGAVAAATRARVAVLYLLDEDVMLQAGTEHVADHERAYLRQETTDSNGVNVSSDEMRVVLKVGVKPRGILMVRGAVLSSRSLEAIGSMISVTLDRAKALENVAYNEAAKESERLRRLMIDSITHELRTPLTSIKGAASALLSGEIQREDDRRELLSIIDQESDRLNRLVSQAVEMAQLDARQVRMTFAPVDVEEIIAETRKDCAWVEDLHPVEVRIVQKALVRADSQFLKKVLANLLENAAKYSGDGSPIVVTVERKGDVLAVSVADKGIGIDQHEQSLIFDRFYRAPAHNQRISGTGMGLSISRAIMEAHGGAIDVVSRPGEGSVFTVTIPLAKAS